MQHFRLVSTLALAGALVTLSACKVAPGDGSDTAPEPEATAAPDAEPTEAVSILRPDVEAEQGEVEPSHRGEHCGVELEAARVALGGVVLVDPLDAVGRGSFEHLGRGCERGGGQGEGQGGQAQAFANQISADYAPELEILASIGTSVSRTSTGNAVWPAKVLMPTIEGSVNQTPAPVDTAREAA